MSGTRNWHLATFAGCQRISEPVSPLFFINQPYRDELYKGSRMLFRYPSFLGEKNAGRIKRGYSCEQHRKTTTLTTKLQAFPKAPKGMPALDERKRVGDAVIFTPRYFTGPIGSA
jgi:hypothetical protein